MVVLPSSRRVDGWKCPAGRNMLVQRQYPDRRMNAAFDDSFPLRPARVHEVCGPGATGFAVMAGAGIAGPMIWISEGRRPGQLNPVALSRFLDPGRLLLARTRDQVETLAVAEEALRDGAAPLVVAETTRPLSLREGRRLQLAAKNGGTTGLCLIPDADGMGSNAAETRWHVTQIFDDTNDGLPRTRWRLVKNKSGTIGARDVRWHPESRRMGWGFPYRSPACDLKGAVAGNRASPARERGVHMVLRNLCPQLRPAAVKPF